MKKGRLYNLIFPFWLMWLLPPFVIVAAVLNLIIDSLVVIITAWKLNANEIIKKHKKTIWKVWGYGFLADLIGVAFVFVSSTLLTIATEIFDISYLNDIRLNVDYNPFGNVFAFIITALGIAVAGYYIYRFNKKHSFSKTDIPEEIQKKLALVLSIATAPYTFLMPAGLFEMIIQNIM